LNSSIPINAEAIIPVSTSDVSSILPIALTIPDFEGSVSVRIFSNSSQTEIGCFQAQMTNGATLSHPSSVSTVLGIFTVVAMLASFATTIYGVSIPHVRTHYAHSVSVLVIFEVFQSNFFSGTLALNWPSVCAAFWSNFAWSAGMIYSAPMLNSINHFINSNLGNSSQVGGAGSSTINSNGGLQQQIYGRSWEEDSSGRLAQASARIYGRADSTSAGRGYSWAGVPIADGLTTPGNWSGFAGTLSDVGIPQSDAFMVGFLWLLILLLVLIAATVAFKWLLEGFSALKWIKEDRLALFRSHWLGYMGLIVLRTLFIGFFMMMTLTIFQFSYKGPTAVTAIAAIVFLIFFLGGLGVCGYACFYRLRLGRYESSPDQIRLKPKKLMKVIPWVGVTRESSMTEEEKAAPKFGGSMPFIHVKYIDKDSERQSVHEDEDYNKKFGWLSARFRRTRWWFFAVWVVYQFVRACFIGGAQSNPTAQVIGLLVVEIIALIGIVCINPFEGSRNTALAVYMLSISKVATAGLSIAFLPQYNLNRIITTVIGVIIIVIQGFLTIGLMILIILGAISSYMSLSRNREDFRPNHWQSIRLKYFERLEHKAADLPPTPPPLPEQPQEPYFSVNTVRRVSKIEDEEPDFIAAMPHPAESVKSFHARSRTNSMRSNYSGYGNAPFGARVHRASWSAKDFGNWAPPEDIPEGSQLQDGPHRSTSRMSMRHISTPSILSLGAVAAGKVPMPLRTAISSNEIRPMGSVSEMQPITPTTPTTPTTSTVEQQRAVTAQKLESA
jgi:meiotic recombination protein REC8